MATAQAARRLARTRARYEIFEMEYDWWFAPKNLLSEILSIHRFPSHLRRSETQPAPPPPMGLVIIDDGVEGFVVQRLLPVIEVTDEELVALYVSNNLGGVRPDYRHVPTRFRTEHGLRGLNRCVKFALLALAAAGLLIWCTRALRRRGFWRGDEEDEDDGSGPPPGGRGGLLALAGHVLRVRRAGVAVAVPSPRRTPLGGHGGGGLLEALAGHALLVRRAGVAVAVPSSRRTLPGGDGDRGLHEALAVVGGNGAAKVVRRRVVVRSIPSPRRTPTGGYGGGGLHDALTGVVGGNAATQGLLVRRRVVAKPSRILANALSAVEAEARMAYAGPSSFPGRATGGSAGALEAVYGAVRMARLAAVGAFWTATTVQGRDHANVEMMRGLILQVRQARSVAVPEDD